MSDEIRPKVAFERLRWILVLPAAIVTGAAVLLVTALLCAIVSMGLFFVEGIVHNEPEAVDISFMRFAFFTIAAWSLAPAGFVFGGGVTAPKNRVHVAIGLGIIAAIFMAVFSSWQLRSCFEPRATELYFLRYFISTLGSIGMVGLLYILRDRKLNYKIFLLVLLILVVLIVCFVLVLMFVLQWFRDVLI